MTNIIRFILALQVLVGVIIIIAHIPQWVDTIYAGVFLMVNTAALGVFGVIKLLEKPLQDRV